MDISEEVMKSNIIVHIDNTSFKEKIDVITDQLDLIKLEIENYEEFFHALMHVKPVMFIVEISRLNDPYLKIIRIIKKSILTSSIPIVVITSSVEVELIDQLTQLDINTLIYPPVIDSYLHFSIKKILLEHAHRKSFSTIQDVKAVQSVMISGLASLAEYRDPETGEHIKRTQNYVKALAITMKRKGLYPDELTTENIETIYMSVPLHDIGKVGIRDEILLKPERLTNEEFVVMKTHTTLGHKAIMNVGSKLKSSAFLNYAADVAYTHHEKFDGSGYPKGLKGKEIPLVGRLMAVADVYDALISKRVYKNPMTHDDAMEIIKAGSGTHFDPEIVECAIYLEKTFQNISQTYSDSNKLDGQGEHLTKLKNNNLLMKILIVEDSRMVRVILKNQFLAMGFIVDEAEDGQVGLDKIRKNDYDLVLLDIEMPNMNGYEMVSALSSEGELPIIIAMTAADYNITLSELKKLGIMGLILKPVDLNYLGAKYSEILRERGQLIFKEDGDIST